MNRTSKNCFFLSRLSALIVVFAMLLALCACGDQHKQQEKTVRIGMALYAQEDTFISTIAQNMQQLLLEKEQETGVKLSLITSDARSNQTTQLSQIDTFISRGYDIICVNVVDRTVAAVIIDKAQQANIPLIFFNREPVAEDIARWEQVYYVGARARQSGTIQGQLVVQAWHEEQQSLDLNGDGVLQYAMLEGESGHQDALLRTEYSIKALLDAGIETEKVVSDTANWSRGQAANKMRTWLAQLDTQLEVIFCNNDDMALGVIDAYHEAQLPLPLIVGVDATAPALEAVRAGELYGTVLNDAQGIAQTMLALSLALERGEDPADAAQLEQGHYVWLEYKPVTKENLSHYLQGYTPDSAAENRNAATQIPQIDEKTKIWQMSIGKCKIFYKIF